MVGMDLASMWYRLSHEAKRTFVAPRPEASIDALFSTATTTTTRRVLLRDIVGSIVLCTSFDPHENSD